MEDKGRRTTVWLSGDSHEKLRRFAFESKMTNSDVVRQALELLYKSGAKLQAKSSVYPRTIGLGDDGDKQSVGDDGLVHEKYE